MTLSEEFFLNITLKKFWSRVSILKGTFSAVSAALTGAPVVGVAAITVAVGAVGPAGRKKDLNTPKLQFELQI